MKIKKKIKKVASVSVAEHEGKREFPLFPKEFSVMVKITKEVKHEKRIFPVGSKGVCTNTEIHRKGKTYPVWLANVKYPVYLQKDEMEEV